MSSKFSGILSQARNRTPQEDDELPSSEVDTQATKKDFPTSETDPLPRASVTSNTNPSALSPPTRAKAVPSPASKVKSVQPARSGTSSDDVGAQEPSRQSQGLAPEPLFPRGPASPDSLSSDALPEGGRGRPRGKRSDPNFTQITAYISKQTHQSIKMALLREGQNREISQLIEERLVAWLATQKTEL